MSKRKRPYEIKRYTMGIWVSAGGRSFPSSHLVYEVLYSDGTSRIERGLSVHGIEGSYRLNMTKKQIREDLTTRTDLFSHMHAAKILLNDLESACLLADKQNLPTEDKKRFKDNYQ